MLYNNEQYEFKLCGPSWWVMIMKACALHTTKLCTSMLSNNSSSPLTDVAILKNTAVKF